MTFELTTLTLASALYLYHPLPSSNLPSRQVFAEAHLLRHFSFQPVPLETMQSCSPLAPPGELRAMPRTTNT